MIDETQKAKIGHFLADKEMSEAVYSVVLDSFLKERLNQDVYVLAASKLAIDYLKQGWKELEKLRRENEPPTRNVVQKGV